MWGTCDDCGKWTWKHVSRETAVRLIPASERPTLRALLAEYVQARCFVCNSCGALGFALGA